MRWSLLLMLAITACEARAQQAPVPPAEAPKPEPPTAPKDYEIAASVIPPGVIAGQQARYQLTITPRAPWVLKVETPFDVKLAGTEGVTLGKDKLTAKDVIDPKSAAKMVSTTFTATSGAAHAITADLSFFLCTPEICKRERDKASVSFAVK